MTDIQEVPVGFTFPGFGSQHLKMFSRLPSEVTAVRLTDMVGAFSGLDLMRVVEEGPDNALVDVRASFPALVIADGAWSLYLESQGLKPSVCWGYGVGEIAALVAAGTLTLGSAVTLALRYAQSLATVGASSDGVTATVLGLSEDEVHAVIENCDTLWISAINSRNQVMISGAQSSLTALEPELITRGARRVVKLALPGAFHCPMMLRVQDDLRPLVEKMEFRAPVHTFVSCVDGKSHEDPEEIKELFLRSITEPIRYKDATDEVAENCGVHIAVECGSGSLLSGYLVHSDLTSIPVTQYVENNGIGALEERIDTLAKQRREPTPMPPHSSNDIVEEDA